MSDTTMSNLDRWSPERVQTLNILLDSMNDKQITDAVYRLLGSSRVLVDETDAVALTVLEQAMTAQVLARAERR